MMDKAFLPEKIRNKIKQFESDRANGIPIDKIAFENLFEEILKYSEEQEKNKRDLHEIISEQKDLLNKLSALLDESSEGYVIFDSEFLIRVANKTFADLAGTNTESLINSSILKLISPESQNSFKRHIRQVQKSGRKEDLKLTLEGLTRSREIILDCQSIKQGHSIHIRCKCRDITEKSEAEAELSQTRVKFQNLMEVIRDGVVLLDAECRIVDANLQFCGMTGYTLNELKKTENFFLLSSELTRSWEQEEVWGKLVKDGFTDVYEKEFICRDGQLLTAEFNFNAMQAVKGEPQYFWGIARDISERIRAGKALLDQDERFDAVALFINDWEYWRGVDGKIQYVSPACERITGYSTNEFEQNTNLLEEIVHPDDLETYRKHKILTGRHQSGAEIHSINFRIICRDKSVKWIAHSCQNIRTSDGTYLGIRGSNRDISDKKYIEEDLEQKNRSLSFLNNLALDLAELPFDADLNIYLTKKLKEFTEGIFVSFSEYDKSNGTLVLQHTEIENKLLDKVLQVLNQSKLSINSPVSKEMYDTMIKTIIGIRHSLSQITFGAIPPKPGMIIKSLMNADRFYALVYVVEGELYGTSVIGLRTDQPDPPADFLVSFSHLAAMSLRRRKAELALRESEESIRTTLYSIGDAVISTNKNGNIRQMNPVAEKLTGWTEADAKGMALEEVFNIINEDSREKVENPVHKILREGMVIGLANHTLLLEKNGKEIPIADSGAPILDVNGKIDGVILVFRDQTEDRKAHKALLKEKETASQYFNIAGVIMLVLDRDARIKHINRRGCEILGYEPGEIIGMDWIASFIPAGDKQLISNAFQEIINGKIQINEYLENPVLCRDGEEKLIAWHNAVIRDDDGNITGTISSGDDITIRRQVEEALRESEEKYRSLIENMLDAVIIIGFDGLIQFYNPSVLNLYGGTKEFNPIGQSIGEFLYPESLLSAMTNLVKVKNGEKISAIYQLIKADGKLAWVDTLSTKIQYRGKEGALVILHDITEQKLNEESLRLSEERFAKAFKSNPAAVIITRQADGLIIDVNESYQRMFGYNREELIGQTGIGLNIFDDPDLRNDVISQLQITGAVRNYETKLRSKQGDQLSVLLSVEKIEINRENCLLSIVHDITERKNAEDKLIESEQRYHSFINTHSDLIFVKDENFRYIVVNDALAGFFNKSKEEILFKTDFELRNKETAGLCYTSDKEVTETKARVRLQEKVGDRVFEGIKFPVQLKGGITGVGGIVQDITDRKKAEDKLVESSNRINAILDTMPDMMFIIDNKGTFIEYFSRSKENLGLPPENIIGNNISALFSPEEVKRHLSVYRKALDNGTLETLEYQLTQKGKELYFEAQITPFGTNQVLCIVRNITERKRMEEEIRYHSGMQNLVTRLGNKFINISRNRLDAAVNEAMAEIGEFTHVDRVYLFDYDFEKGIMINTHEWCADGINPEIANLQAIQMSDFPDWVKPHQSGETIYVPSVAALDPSENLRQILEPQNIQSLITIPMFIEGICLGFVGFDSVKHERSWSDDEVLVLNLFADLLTNLKIKSQVEDKLLEVESINQFITSNITDAVCLVDPEGKYTYVTPSHAVVTGRGMEVIGENFLKYIHAEDYKKVLHIIVTGSDSGSAKNVEYRYLHPKKGYIWLESTGKRHYDANGNLFGLITSRNISERMRDQAELIAAKEKAEESDRLKTAFLNNMSHEIRTPLNVIMGFTELLRDPLKSQDEYHYFSRIITQSSNHLLSIINDIMSIATIEAGQEKLRESPADINKILERLYEQFSIRIESKEVVFYLTSRLAENKTKVLTDETKVVQILSNLISNAIKFTHKGKIEYGCVFEGEFLKFFVEDTGIGIPRAFHEHIFERFRQVDDKTTRKYGGNGLGLSISKAYCELLGGKIQVESEPGKGSKFIFTVPYKSSGHVPIPETSPIHTVRTNGFNGIKTILIAEDEMSNYLLLEKLLANDGFKIIHVVNGKQAVENCMSDLSIDLVLMDLKMPVMDGLIATGLIKKERPQLPVIALTAYALSGDREKALNAGCDEYISKPFNKQDLLTVMRRFLYVN